MRTLTDILGGLLAVVGMRIKQMKGKKTEKAIDNLSVCEECGKASDVDVPDICVYCLRCPDHCEGHYL